MPGDIDLSGYVFTREEWLELSEDLRSELLRVAEELGQIPQDTDYAGCEA